MSSTLLVYLVLCVSQNSLHGSLGGGLDHLLDVVVLGLEGRDVFSQRRIDEATSRGLDSKQLDLKGASRIDNGGGSGGPRTGFSRRTVRSTTETLGVGTRKAMPVSLLQRRRSYR